MIGLGRILSLEARRALAPLMGVVWGSAVALLLALRAASPPEDDGSLGYVVPGSGVLARSWAIIGRRLYQLRQLFVYTFKYLRDINLLKIHLPVTVLLLLLLAGAGLAQALENALFEIPLNLSSLVSSTGWIAPVAKGTAVVITLVLGLPMFINSVARAHQRSVQLREGGKTKVVGRLLRGLSGLLLVFPPVAWMALQLVAGKLT
jgi:hypothetical protein